MAQRRPLRLFMPGAFADISRVIRSEFASGAPEIELAFHEFIPSGLLAREIRAGAQADIYVSANTRYMDELFNDGLVTAPTVLAGNRLCIIARPDAPEVTGLDSLLDPSLSVVVPQPETDPCGQYVAAMFREAGIEERMAAKLAAGSLIHSRGSGDLPGYLFDGRVVAGIFYSSEAKVLGERVVTIALPERLDFHDRILFTIGQVVRPDPHPARALFQSWLTGDAGQAILIAGGFTRADLSQLPAGWG